MKKFILLIICLFLCSCTRTATVSRESVIGSKTPVSTKLKLTMVGDALIHKPIFKDAYKNGIYDFNSVFTEFKSVIESSDLLYYNQESIIGGEELGYDGYPRFNTPSEFALEMIDLGFNIVSRANNHTLDKGEAGILNSCNFWNEHPNVLTNGSACTKDEMENIRVFEKSGITYSMLSYTLTTNGLKSREEYYVNIYNDERVKNDVNKVRQSSDIVMVAMHWGDEYRSTPNEEQKRIASYLASIGVDIVIGSHPHVIEPVEWIDDTLVIYSLGNFISAQSTVNDYNRRIGLVVNVDIIKTVTDHKTKVELDNLSTSLVYTHSNGNVNFKLIPFSKMDESILKNYKAFKTKCDGIVKYYDSNIQTE